MPRTMPLGLLIATLLCALGASSAQAAKVRGPGPWKPTNTYLVTADLDGRALPQAEPRARIDHVRAGQWKRIQCQVSGQNAYGSKLWDKIDGLFVPDHFIKTYTDGRIPGVPSCGEKPAPQPAPAPAPKELPTPQGGYGSYDQIYDLGTRFKGWSYGELTNQLTHRFSRYFSFQGCGARLRVGKECSLEAPGPNGPVRVTTIAENGFALLSLPGHPEGAGRTITFRFFRTCAPSNDFQFCDHKYLRVNAWGPVSKASLLGPFNAETVAKHYWSKFRDNIKRRYPRCPKGKAWVKSARTCGTII